MEEARMEALPVEPTAFKIPRKSVAVGYQPITTVSHPDFQESNQEKVDISAKASRFVRWLAIVKSFLGWLAALPDRPWLPELVSLMLACVALAAIIITLAVHQGRPIPQWPHLISINSLIAVFTAILKAAIIMPVAEGIGQLKWDWFRKNRVLIDLDRLDSASRGPWGSFLLLSSRNKSRLATFGAVLTIVALATDPFSQQVIRYSPCIIPIGGPSVFLPVANNYTDLGPENRWTDYGEPLPLGRRTVSSMYSGLMKAPTNASATIPFRCATGNCTFSENPEHKGATHMSLAMCSECKDISSSIIATREPTNYVSDPLYIVYALAEGSGVSISTLNGCPSEGRPWVALQNGGGRVPWIYVASFEVIMFRNCSCTGSAGDPCVCEPWAGSCTLFPCVKKYHAEIRNNVLYETELGFETFAAYSPGPHWEDDLTNIILVSQRIVRDGEPINCSNTTTPTSQNNVPVMWNSTQYLNEVGYKYNYTQQECVWTMDVEYLDLLTVELDGLWVGNLTADENLYATPSTVEGAPWLLPIFNNGTATLATLQNYIGGLASTLTADIRQFGDVADGIKPIGTTWQGETCIEVQWVWLSLPAALLLLAIAFLAQTIWQMRSGQVLHWKSSPLALLFHGLGSGIKEQYGALEEIRDIRAAASSVQARVDQHSGTWQLTPETVSKMAT